MNTVARFPFQLFEAVNGHGYSMEGELLHMKVLFVRYLEEDHKTFDCVIDCDGIKSFFNTKYLWRDGDTVPPSDLPESYRPFDIDRPVQSKRPTLNLVLPWKEGDVLVRETSDDEIEIVSTKEAPSKYRVRSMENGKYHYFDYSNASLALYSLKETCE